MDPCPNVLKRRSVKFFDDPPGISSDSEGGPETCDSFDGRSLERSLIASNYSKDSTVRAFDKIGKCINYCVFLRFNGVLLQNGKASSLPVLMALIEV